MGILSRNFGAFASLAVLVCGSMLAQTPSANVAEGPTFTFRSDTRLVDLHATVVDKQGHLVLGLPESAFKLYEDGAQQVIANFRREDVPVSLGLIIDNSASMRDKRAKVASAALALVAASNPEDEVFIMNFNEELHQQHQRAGRRAEDDQLTRRHGHARRATHGHRAPAARRQKGKEDSAGGQRRRR